jgi:hypothetical protein
MNIWHVITGIIIAGLVGFYSAVLAGAKADRKIHKMAEKGAGR